MIMQREGVAVDGKCPLSVVGRRVFPQMRTSAATPPTALSPSRAGDFMQCPLLYRFRVIQRLPEKPSAAATRGTVVHAVLERLFDAPAQERSAPRARSLVAGEWERLLAKRPELAELFAEETEDAANAETNKAAEDAEDAEDGKNAVDGTRLAQWLAQAEQLLERCFTLEDPTRLEPAERELFVETGWSRDCGCAGTSTVSTSPLRVKCGSSTTRQGGAARRFRGGGAVPDEVLRAGAVAAARHGAAAVAADVPRQRRRAHLRPRRGRSAGLERKVEALWQAISAREETGDWRPKPGKLCGWCDHQAHCPEFGGTPPPYPLMIQPRLPEPRSPQRYEPPVKGPPRGHRPRARATRQEWEPPSEEFPGDPRPAGG